MDENLLFKQLHRPIELEIRVGEVINIFETRIVDIAPETIGVDAPKDEAGNLVPLEGGTRIKLLVTEGSVVFMFDSLIIGGKAVDNTAILVLQKPANMTKAQRRGSFRVPTEEFPVDVTVLEGTNSETIHGICKEISGGGMMLVVDNELPADCSLELKFQLKNEPEQFTVIGQVKRIDHMKRGSLYEFRLGIFFANISERMREKIIKYTFRQQRLLIQRGLL